MLQTAKCHLFLYADFTCLVWQHEDVNEIEKQLNEDCSNICDWCEDIRLCIHFGETNTKSILFTSRFEKKTLKRDTT